MKHHANTPNEVGVFSLDGTETVDEVKAAVLARREQVWPGHRWNARFLEVKPPRMPRPRKRRPIPEGDGEPHHAQRVAAAIERCEAAGVEFWALGPNPQYVWGVTDGAYVQVWSGGTVRVHSEPRSAA